VRVENIPEPTEHIPDVLSRVKRDYIFNTYKVKEWEDSVDFLTQFAKITGKLLKVTMAVLIALT
jgi:nuclear GTP-binding protein